LFPEDQDPQVHQEIQGSKDTLDTLAQLEPQDHKVMMDHQDHPDDEEELGDEDHQDALETLLSMESK